MAGELTWHVRATVARIVDGDTFVASLDLGWGIFRDECAGAPCRVRILSYNTPERGQPDYARAIAALSGVLPIGIELWVVSHKLDSFGRALCDCFLKDGTNVLDLLPPEWRV
jgi:endonuclease YncB( thermonuclease family)